MSIGSIITFNSSFGIFVSSATSLSNTVVNSLQVVNLWQRAQPILLAQLEVDDNKADPGRLSGRLALDHMTFATDIIVMRLDHCAFTKSNWCDSKRSRSYQ